MDPLRSNDPASIGRYRLLGRLGAGGMGVVYLAEGPRGRVALKIVRPELGDDPAFRSRFRREIQASFRVLSERTARLIDFDSEAEQPWMATEFVDGISLEEEISQGGPLTTVRQRSLAVGLAEALVAIHTEGVVHRDLKPTNVILSPRGPIVIDFGIAAAADAARITSTGLVVGSSGWLAPERVETGDSTAASDVFAFGLLLCFAASGVPPYGTGPSDVLLYRALHMPPNIPRERLDPQLADLVLAATSREPANRPTAQQLLAMLDASGNVGDVARTTSAAAFLPPTELSTALPPAPDDPIAFGQASTIVGGAEARSTAPPERASTVADSGAAGGGGAPNRSTRRRWLLPAAAVTALAVIGGTAGALVGTSGSGHPNASFTLAPSDVTSPTATVTASASRATVRLTAARQVALATAASVRDGDFPRALQPVNRTGLFLPCGFDQLPVPSGSVLRGMRWAVNSPNNGNFLSETVAVMPTVAAGATVFNEARSKTNGCHTYELTTNQQIDTVTITDGPKSIGVGDASVYVEETLTPKNYKGPVEINGIVIVQRGAVVVYLFLEYSGTADLTQTTALAKTLVQRIDAAQ